MTDAADPSDWLPFFLARHRERFAPHDWPADDCDEYVDMMTDWIEAFRRFGVAEDEANRASRRLTLNAPRWKREHLPAVVETVKVMRAERAPASDADTRDGAAALSRGCPRCDGVGLAVVATNAGRAGGEVVRETCAAHCTCCLGRWMRRTLASNRESEHLLKRIPDLERLPWGYRELREVEPAEVPS